VSKGTDRRTVRIAPEIWEAARAVAHERGETISDVIRRGLLGYIAEQPEITKALALDRLTHTR
jgi:antitoxin component of RelBE/YafQ-DinJ toxin-antitoxin module